ncbi:MAG: hypothetical protein AUJ92_17335 [Armatimonadetes bacterium CG2_30_59_28]|nr:MAG: hypothetical protein AUJ92_17335 [Armatimonadetes bacterium CG2_30_59_28]PIU63169.1 MAG: hypothetical protein COS85_16570 [Armatimonadetes bacterium CG07_land_8_20_14_0_80_59_28]PIX43636.1 MAG: hypothetical protein COZ56_06760 [Armatimonadetes bacterium CG_4_8_14_3_um_filter_58_9]PIY49434.1 MAG: hypothetical protein COZ05_00430 [Armatimonadetes bacterium CG_4_10_14_3_um_filter_59_10]PJB76491.1 MAG: hypothetical protein CO095_02495 [Armatimonadetes bacterium CG_4_9_14_3_um_filter_58_7]
MDAAVLSTRLERLEREIRLLRSHVRDAGIPAAPADRGLRSLKGIWRGVDLTLEEIRDAEVRVKDSSQ